MTRAALLALVVLGCREHEVALDKPAAAAVAVEPAPQTQRVLYPSTPGSFVDLVERSKHGVVALRAAAPVKSGPAAMFPGAPETTADVALGTGFLIEAKGVYVLTTDHIAAASPSEGGSTPVASAKARKRVQCRRIDRAQAPGAHVGHIYSVPPP